MQSKTICSLRQKCRCWFLGIFILAFFFFYNATHAQMLVAKPEAQGGNPVGSWAASQEQLGVYAPAEVVAAVAGFELGGDLTGTIAFSGDGSYSADYITTAKVTVSFLGLPIQIDVADTNKTEGTYTLSGSAMIFMPNNAASDTVNFTATIDSLHLIQRVPLQGFESLAAGLVPADDPIVSILSFGRIGEPETHAPVEVIADFDGSGTVDFPDFLAFVSHFGTQSGSAGYDAVFDLDSNGAVDFTDFLNFAAQFGLTKSA